MLNVSVKDTRDKLILSGWFDNQLDDEYIESDFAKKSG